MFKILKTLKINDGYTYELAVDLHCLECTAQLVPKVQSNFLREFLNEIFVHMFGKMINKFTNASF